MSSYNKINVCNNQGVIPFVATGCRLEMGSFIMSLARHFSGRCAIATDALRFVLKHLRMEIMLRDRHQVDHSQDNTFERKTRASASLKTSISQN